MINSNEGLVQLLRSGVVQDLSDPSEGMAYLYTYLDFPPQAVKFTFEGYLYETPWISAVLYESGPIVNGVATISNTYVIWFGIFFLLAEFLVFEIDWNSRRPIDWVLSAESDSYRGLHKVPVFADSVSFALRANDHISSILREF